MRAGRIIRHRLRSLFQRARADAEVQREIDLHLDQLTRELIAEGLSEAEARLAARRQFGSLEVVKEDCRTMRRVHVVEDLMKDLAYALRLLRKSPGFALTAILSLALGIGATTALFSLVDAVLMRTLPVPEPQRLVEIGRVNGGTLSYPMYEAIRDRNEVFTGVLALSNGRFVASVRVDGRDFGDARLCPVSGGFFDTLGVSPTIGRVLAESDLAAESEAGAVLSEAFWTRAFARDPGVLGKVIRLGDRTFTVVGVASNGFDGVALGQPIDVWVPITWFNRDMLRNQDAFVFRLLARLKPGATEAQARANVDLLAREQSAQWHYETPLRVDVVSGSGGLNGMRRRFAQPLLVLMAVAGLLLLITAANVANLLLARASARQREIAVRLSLGASRWRLIRQLLTESLVLGAIGGAIGLWLAPVVATVLVGFLSTAFGEMRLALAIDARMLAFTSILSMAVVLLFGLVPALAATRLSLSPMLKSGPSPLFHAGGSRSGRLDGATRPGRLLVVAQVAISCVLLVGAVLFGRSLHALTHADAGFEWDQVLLLHVRTAQKGQTAAERVRVYERVMERLSRLPGVRSTALSSETLFSGNSWTEPISAPGFVPTAGQARDSVLLVVSPRFFQTMSTTLLRGRDFEPRDDERAPRVAIVNEATARYYFGDVHTVVGRTFRIGSDPASPPLTVVGLVQDAKYRSLREPATRLVYLPYLQHPAPIDGANIAVRTAAPPEMTTDRLWEEARAEEPSLRWSGASTQARLVDATLAQDRMLAQLSGFFGLTAAALVCLGLYGLTAYEVSRRKWEIGLRLALGAQRASVVRMMVGRSTWLVTAGVAIGLLSALVLAQAIESLLFGVRGTDLLTFSSAAALLLAIGAVAAYWPARRASRVDPLTSLRHD